MTATKKTLDDLRAPFPPAVIGKLPRKTPGGGTIHLDYVGHAAVTDRLLTIDPAWSWEPVAWDDSGLPAYDRNGGLWIRLTVLGTTRLGYGDGPDPKQRIGDAIRNAAMRFGVALDLWTKGELESQDPNGGGGDVVKGPRLDSYAAQRGKGNPAEETPWTEPVAQPARTTDKEWLKAWSQIVASAVNLDILREQEERLKEQWTARRLTEADKNDAKGLLDEKRVDLETEAQRAERDEAKAS